MTFVKQTPYRSRVTNFICLRAGGLAGRGILFLYNVIFSCLVLESGLGPEWEVRWGRIVPAGHQLIINDVGLTSPNSTISTTCSTYSNMSVCICIYKTSAPLFVNLCFFSPVTRPTAKKQHFSFTLMCDMCTCTEARTYRTS